MSTPFLLTVAAIYFMNQIATYGVIFFVPSIVQAMDVTDTFVIGLISGVVGIGAKQKSVAPAQRCLGR